MTVAPEGQIMGLANEFFASRALHLAVGCGVADCIDTAPVPLATLADSCKSDAMMLGRILALLETRGLFVSTVAGWTHSDASRLLRIDHPASLAPFIRMIGSDAIWQCAGALDQTLRSGTTAADHLYDGGLWGHFQRHPAESARFDAAMQAKAHGEIAAIVPVLGVRQARIVADIGGGRGHVLAAILDRFPMLTGILVDQPHVVSGAVQHPRLTAIGADFFEDALPAADLYVLGNIVHDWADDLALKLLQAVRRAAPDGARIALFEMLLPDGAVPHPGYNLDICMMATTGGRERTAAGYADLLARAGWRMTEVCPTASPTAIVYAERD